MREGSVEESRVSVPGGNTLNKKEAERSQGWLGWSMG